MKSIVVLLLLFSGLASGHEMLPTYPVLEPSYVDDVMQVKMRMFNKRADAEWYEISVFDDKWNPVDFVTGYRVINIRYLSHVSFDVYIRKQDAKKAKFICSRSKLRKGDTEGTIIASRICSKFRNPAQ
jgi:hypothetical protein